jgi:ATP-binding cassette subfamily B protein
MTEQRPALFPLYGRVLGLLGPEKNLAITLAVANAALAVFGFIEPILFGKTVDLLTQAQARGAEATWRAGVPIFSLWALVGVGGIVAGIWVALHADRLAHRIRLAVMARYFEHVLALHFGFHTQAHTGRLLKVMLGGSENLFGLWLSFLREHLSTFVALLVLLPLTLFVNWKMALLLMFLIVGSALLNQYVVRRTHKLQGQVEEYRSAVAERAGDAINNVALVQSFVRLASEARMMRDVMQKLLAAQYPVLNWWALVTVLTGAAGTITTIAIFVLGAHLNLKGEITVGEIVTFMGFAGNLLGRVDQAIGFVNRLFFDYHGLKEFFDVLDTEPAVRDKPGAVPLEGVFGAVEFDNVSFSYDGKRAAVADVSFRAQSGQMLALVGTTGAGKSTLMSLLYRQRDPQSGVIRLDGLDIREVTLDSLRHNIGVVFQENLLFFRSIAENLRVGKPDATDAELEQAARLAQAHEFIMEQPQGYQTRIGERGTTLSGGERQRLAIARVLLKNPPILILDEATSALDVSTEARVQQALKTLMKGRTTFVIAHRLSTVREADRILVFDKGRIVEQGGFNELTRKGGMFAELVATQLMPPVAERETAVAVANGQTAGGVLQTGE